jgi:hypothetical protein
MVQVVTRLQVTNPCRLTLYGNFLLIVDDIVTSDEKAYL